MPVAATGHLIALKLLSRSEHRLLDQRDLQELLVEANDVEIERAREAVKLICKRGYNRDRDLISDLAEALAR